MKNKLFFTSIAQFYLKNSFKQKSFLVLTFFITSLSFGQVNISNTNGNVGIGTPPPTDDKLEVNGQTKIKNNLLISGVGSLLPTLYLGSDRNEETFSSPKIEGYGTSLNLYSPDKFRFIVAHNEDSYFTGMTLDTWGTLYISDDIPVNTGDTSDTKLQVKGIIKSYVPTLLGTSLNNFQLLDERAGTVGNNNMYNRLWSLRDANGANDYFTARLHDGISVDASFVNPHVDTRTWWERDPKDNIQSWGNAGDTYLTINNGNIGIGTTTPNAHLDVYTNLPTQARYDSQIWSTSINSSYNLKLQTIWNYNGINQEFVQRYNNVDYTSLAFYAGNVGIGTSNPDSKLAVNGTIHAKEVRVDLVGWPDYVFANTYDLKSLASVEQYIKQKGHLPNVPSAIEIEEKGLELSKISKIQQEKIEELTLYLIQQNKEIEELKAQVKAILSKQ